MLYITNMWPNELEPYSGIFIAREVKHLKRRGIDVEIVFINGRKSKLEYIKSLLVIFDRLSKKKFDVINVQHSLLLPQTLLAKKLLRLKAPMIYTFHEGELSNKSAGSIIEAIFASRKWKAAFIKYVDFVIARNAQILGDCGNKPVLEMPSPVDAEIFKPLDKAECRSKLHLRMNKAVIFFPADPKVPGKNFAFLKEVVEELNKSREQEFEIITGPVLPEEMALYYNACDVVCLPSLYEASPVVIREAMACSRPIVASDVGDIGQTIRNVDGCFVVRDWNKNDFGECILKTLQYESTKGRERILEMGWDSETSAKRMLSALNQLTHSAKPQRRKAQ